MKQIVGNDSLDVSIDFADTGPQSLFYNADGTLNYVEVTVKGVVYRQTFGYSAGRVSTISQWVAQ